MIEKKRDKEKENKTSAHSTVSIQYTMARRYGRKPMTFLLILLVILVALGLYGFRFAYTTMLPDVVELSEAEAVEVLEDYGVQVEIQRDWSDRYEEGMVIKQNPEGGVHVSANETVSIVISKGVRTAHMPNLIGRKKDEAIALLDQTGIIWMLSEEYSDEAEAGVVLSQSLNVGKEVQTEEMVLVVVSKGEKPVVRTSKDI